jgi:hypothetical protein
MAERKAKAQEVFNGTQVPQFETVMPPGGGYMGLSGWASKKGPAKIKFQNLIISKPSD